MPSDATLTFLFTDIEGSTRRWEASSGMHDRVEEHFRVLREAIRSAGGEVFATMGDGVAAAFGCGGSCCPVPRSQLSSPCPSTGLPVRMGIHSGSALRAGADYRGRTLNRAARIAGCAHGGQVLVSETTAPLLRASGSDLGLADLGVHHLRDLSEPERLWQLVAPQLPGRFPPLRTGPGSALPLRRSSLVGRADDIERVAAAHRAASAGHPRRHGRRGQDPPGARRCGGPRGQVRRWCGSSTCRRSNHRRAAAGLVAAALPELDGSGRVLLVIDNCEQVFGRGEHDTGAPARRTRRARGGDVAGAPRRRGRARHAPSGRWMSRRPRSSCSGSGSRMPVCSWSPATMMRSARSAGVSTPCRWRSSWPLPGSRAWG